MATETVNAADFAVLRASVQALLEAVNDMRAELKSKPSTAQVEQMIEHLVSKREHDKHTWEIEQIRKDMERLAKETDDKFESNSPKRLWGNLTAVVSGLVSLIALLVALGVIKR